MTLDIETRPNLAYVWGLWEQNVGLNQIEDVCSVICWAAKWYGDKKVLFASDHHDGHEAMVLGVYELMCEADAIVTFNGRSFDIPHLHREFLLAGFGPPAPHKDIDLYLTAKRRFRFESNKLEHVATQLGLGAKAQTGGFELWKRCMAGDEQAWDTMRRYNRQDVRLTEKLYERLLPWITGHPNRRLYPDNSDNGCPKCGKVELQRRGVAYTQLGAYQRWHCTACGGYHQGNKRLDWTTVRAVA